MSRTPRDTATNALGRLSGLQATIEPRFFAALDETFNAVNAMQSLANAQDVLHASLAQDRLDAFRDCGEALEALLQSIKGTAQKFGTLATEIDREGRKANDALQRLRRLLQTARFLAIQSKTITAALGQSDATLSTFSELMRGIIEEMHAGIDEMARDLDANFRMVQTISNQVTEFTDRTKLTFGPSIKALRKKTMGLADEAWLVMQADRLKSEIRQSERRISELIPRMHVGDELRQRLDHVIAILRRVESSDPDLGAVLLLLASDQLDSALNKARSETSQAIAEIQTSSSRLTALGDGMATEAQIADLIERVELIVEAATGMPNAFSQMVQVAERARESRDKSQEKVAQLERGMAKLLENEDQIQILGHNSGLVARRKGEVGRAMATIALQLHDLRSEIRAEFERLRMALDTISQHSSALPDAMFSADDQMSVERHAQIACDHARAIVDALGQKLTKSVVAQAKERIATAERDLKAAVQDVTDMAAIAPELRVAARGAGRTERFAGSAVIAEIYHSYTVLAERSVHEKRFGVPPCADHAPAPAETLAEGEMDFFDL